MMCTAAQHPVVGTKLAEIKKIFLQKLKKEFCRNKEQIHAKIKKRFSAEKAFAPRSPLHVSQSPPLLFPTKCLFGINCLTLNNVPWRLSQFTLFIGIIHMARYKVHYKYKGYKPDRKVSDRWRVASLVVLQFYNISRDALRHWWNW